MAEAPRIQDEQATPPKKEERKTNPEVIENGNGDPGMMKVRWKNRRRMAWISLFALVGQVAISLAIVIATDVPVERIKVLVELMSWPSLAFASIIGAYMGFTTWAGKKR